MKSWVGGGQCVADQRDAVGMLTHLPDTACAKDQEQNESDGECMLWWAVPRFWVSFPASSLNLDPLFFTCLVFFLAIPMQECKRAFTAQEPHSLSRLTQVCWNPQVKDWITLKMKKTLGKTQTEFFKPLFIIKHPLPFSIYFLQILASFKDIFQWKIKKGSAREFAPGLGVLSRLISRRSRISIARVDSDISWTQHLKWETGPTARWGTDRDRLKVISGRLKHQACVESAAGSEQESGGRQSERLHSFIVCISVKSAPSFEVKGRLIRQANLKHQNVLWRQRELPPGLAITSRYLWKILLVRTQPPEFWDFSWEPKV